MKNFLDKKTERKLRKRHRSEKNKKMAYRINTILLLHDGWTYEQIAQALLLDDSTIRRYENIFKEEGLEALLKLDYKGSMSMLSAEQEKSLSEHLEENCYLTSKEISQYILERFSVKYSVRGTKSLLYRLGFTYKKPKHIPGKADAQKQIEFLEEVYNVLKGESGEKDKIYFTDAVHPQHNSMPGYGWIKKGKTMELQSNTGRKRININGALSLDGYEVVVREDDTIDADSTVKLLQQLEATNPDADNIHVIADNARYYRAKKVTEYVENSKQLNLVFLPPYSPNLNLIERLWKFFKKKTIYNKYYETYLDFKTACLDFFENIHVHKPELETLITENFQILHSTNFSQS